MDFFLNCKVPELALVVLNEARPILLGIFTVWFQKWYPARGAMGKI